MDSGERPDAARDRDAVTQLLGREPAGAFRVVVRRPGGSPAVIENAPLLRDGRPMPTRFWLVDDELRDAVSRLEAAGGVRRAAESVAADEIAEAHARYAAERDLALPPGHAGPVPSGGVGGTRQGVKCLHAHLAWHLAGGDDPVGRWTAEQIGLHGSEFVAGDGDVLRRHSPVAAVDCGTNSTRLIVVAADGTVLDRQMRITRLGEGVDATGTLSPAAIERTLDALRSYRARMDELGVGRVRAVATSATRDAVNTLEFMTAATRVLGVSPEVLSGDEEGRLSFAGATAHLPAGVARVGRVLVVDIGGGSTELTVGQPVTAATEGSVPAVATRSLDIGCVRVTERYLRHDPPSAAEMDEARAVVAAQIAAAKAALPDVAPHTPLVGLAGTVSTLAALQNRVAIYDRARIHHMVLARPVVEEWLGLLSTETAPARLSRPGMDKGREDVIVGGILVLAETMRAFDAEECLVSEDDILDGLAADLLRRG
jgi:exopolyphosphatase/guanosine-5'-triphosphate,3'-diphosphate pyrophosphatase